MTPNQTPGLDHRTVLKTASWFVIFGSSVALLIFFKNFLQPFVVSLILWFLIVEFRNLLGRITIRGKRLPGLFLRILSTLIIFSLFYFSLNILILNIQKLTVNIHLYSENLAAILENIEDLLGVEQLGERVEAQEGKLINVMTNIAGSLASFVGRFFLVVLYVIFLLLEEQRLNKKAARVVKSKKDSLYKTYQRVMQLFRDYMSIKTLTSFLTALFSYFVLMLLGIDLPALWAFIIFMLNFIPSIGSIIATAFPVLFSIVQYGDLSKTLYVLVGVLAVQVLVGNFLEPRLMGNKLNLSPLVILLALAFWGSVWGIMGMLLSVPITAMMMIIFSQFASTRNIAVFFSHDGEIGQMAGDTE
jgi:predicted PurR-regulated permease PerM